MLVAESELTKYLTLQNKCQIFYNILNFDLNEITYILF